MNEEFTKKKITQTHTPREIVLLFFFPDKSSWNREQYNRVEMQKKTQKKELRKTIVETKHNVKHTNSQAF